MASITAVPPVLGTDEDEIPERRIPMTYDEYWAWGQEEGHHGEWVDGEVIVFMTTSDRHRRILNFLIIVIGIYLNRLRAGEIASQQFELRTREGAAREPDIFVLLNAHLDRLEAVRATGAADLVIEIASQQFELRPREGAAREPDIFVLLNAHLDRLEEVRARGAADLVIEIISPDSVTRDRKVKLAEYAAAGVPEYWIVDPREGRESAQVLLLDPAGQHVSVPPGSDGRLHSRVLPGVWFDPAWLDYGDELPDLIDLSLAMVAAADREWTATSPEPST